MYREFWQLLKTYGSIRVPLSICALTISGSLLEGINIGLLIPLLEYLGSPGQVEGHWLSRAFATVFAAMGVRFGLDTILLFLGILFLGAAGLKYLRLILIDKAVVTFSVWLRTRTMESLLSGDTEYFHHQRLGMLTDTLTTQSSRAGGALHVAADGVSLAAVSLVYLLGAFLIAPFLAAAALGTGLILSLAMQYYVSRARKIADTMVSRQNELQIAGIETLSAIQVVKSFLLERSRWSDYRSKAQAAGESEYLINRNTNQMSVLQEVVLVALVGAIVYVGVEVMGLGMAAIVALLFVLYRLMPRISGLNSRRQQLATQLASLHLVKTVIDQASSRKIVSGPVTFEELTNRIELKQVDFSYNGSSEVLSNTSFTMEKGKMTAIAGASGAGKTTLIDLVLRLYDPTQGSLLVDGVDLRDLELTSWRGSIGVVSQDIFLFNDTVAYNIGLGRLGSSLEAIITAAKRAYAHDFIQQLPHGYETHIGDRGWNLSGGQRQRLALARAILTTPEILILDEATSSLDSESEQLIQQYLNEIRGTCTIIVVAHRLSTIQSADKIVVLQDGKIVEEGDWDSLLAKDGVLANYHNIQSGATGSINEPLVAPPPRQEDHPVASRALPRADGNE